MKKQFTTPCFIRKNMPELRKKLEEMGYLVCSCATMKDHEWLHCANEHLNTSGTVHGIRTTYDHDLNIVPSEQFLFENEHNTDCGTNEALFLDLAAMRSDTDKGQLFTINGKGLRRCNYDNVLYDKTFSAHWRKATPQEIIEWHKKNER